MLDSRTLPLLYSALHALSYVCLFVCLFCLLKIGNFPEEIQVELRKLRDESCLSGEDSINWKEFLAATADRSVMMQEEKIRLAFDHFKQSDQDFIQIADLVDLLGGIDKAKEILGDIDSDGDGKISFEDFHQMMVK